jgi:hypothetical protein
MPTYDSIRISQNDKVITLVTELDIGGRGSSPSRSQSYVEREVKSIHTTCKASSLFLGCQMYYSAIDWYDSCDGFDVPSAKMVKGDRKVTDNSEYCNDTPKSWDEVKHIQFKSTTRNASPIELGLKALGIPTSLVSDVQKMLKKNNGVAYISPKPIAFDKWGDPVQYGALGVLDEDARYN